MLKSMIFVLSFMMFSPAQAKVSVAKYSGSGFTAVSEDMVKSECKANFAFREEFQNETPDYLSPELIKLSFRGIKLHMTLDKAKAAAEKGKKCIWYNDSEKVALGL